MSAIAVVDPETDPATVEHVLPENPAGEWAEAFPPDRWEAAVRPARAT